MRIKRNNFSERVYDLVKKIPKGKVMTYGQIAKKLDRPKAARAVGNILHQNTSSKIPCHRVVNQQGRMARHFAFGGEQKQRELLLKEGVKFKDKLHVREDAILKEVCSKKNF